MRRFLSSLGGMVGFPNRRPADAAALALAALLLVPACVGDIGDTSGTKPGTGTGGPGAPSTTGGSTTGGGSTATTGGSGSGSTTGGSPGMPGADGPIVSSPGPSSQLIRLSHVQWENSVQDLLRLPTPTGLSAQFLAEPLRSLFDNSGGTFEVSTQLWLQYRRASYQVAKDFAHNAALLSALVPKSAPADLEGKARALIRDLGRRAFRRPVLDAEIEPYVTLFKQGPTLGAPGGDPFAEGIELVLTAVLQSPHFLYRVEVGDAPVNGKIQLTDYEVASRLSYGLTRTMPDDALFAKAEAKQVRSVEGVLNEAKRLLDSPAGKLTLRDLHDQVLRDVDPSSLAKDAASNPAFKPGMGVDMKQESDLFIDDVIANGGGLKELLTAPYSFVNASLASLYGIAMPAGAGNAFAKVNLNPAERSGLFTQLGFLAHTANDIAPRPIKRGIFLNHHVLCVEIPPPPPNVNAVVPPVQAAATNRQTYEQLTAPGECLACHGVFINPLGFAFENFDNLGRYRTMDANMPVDATASYEFAEGRKTFTGPGELMRLVADGEQAHGCYASHLFAYTYARDATDTPADKALVGEIARRSRKNASVKSMVLDLVATDAFLSRLP